MNQPIYSRRPTNNSAIPDTIFIILIANGLLFSLQQFAPRLTFEFLALQPIVSPSGYITPSFIPWQLITYGFLHSTNSLMHIIFNMLMLWMFGRDIEMLMGPRRFLIYYITCIVGAGIIQLLVGVLQGGGVPTVGASGGVFGILLAYGMAFPERRIMLIFPPIPMKAKYFVALLGLLEFYLGFSGVNNGVANFAHLGGMLFGYWLMRFWKKD
ncbi:MAG: rhomboid family intramembrane serine protease [Gammaproteobacteria bacterium]|nr:rhomboid family intramembrane serine protease [Gammaproteobacteria bacterium]|tara:strand:- start:884 stop:1519 length:636 start_codon:yes stop_codon:yes gene_type:complete